MWRASQLAFSEQRIGAVKKKQPRAPQRVSLKYSKYCEHMQAKERSELRESSEKKEGPEVISLPTSHEILPIFYNS